MRPFSIIVAFDSQYGIGKNGLLPWKLPLDLKHFKEITTAVANPARTNAVIMGRKTWESLPQKFCPLPGRVNVVLSKEGKLSLPSEVFCSQSLEDALSRLSSSNIENVFVIGHPEGLRFTLSTGIISRTDGSTIQMSAPVSPGNSGGPVFDDKGNLVAIVTSMVDKHGDPNAENLNFSVRADALRQESDWDFAKLGRKHLDDFLASDAVHAPAPAAPAH